MVYYDSLNATMKLREYQQQALDNIEQNLKLGDNKQVIVLATGTGKTVIFAHEILTRIEATNKKALVIAHREELLNQAEDKILTVEPCLKTGIEMAEKEADPSADVIIASVATLGRKNSSRKLKLDPKQFCIVVIDEAHHASADSYKEILRYFGLLKSEPENDWNKECLLLGVTATPNRNDNKGIDQIFNNVTFSFDIIKGITQNYLSRIKAFRVATQTDLTNVHKTAGDFNLGELGEAVNNDDRNGLVIKAYQTITPGKQALCFAVDVAHTEELCKRFQQEGIKAEFVTGATPRDQRAQKLHRFAQHDINVMVNAMVLTEGYDNESIEVILMARPTQSGILFQQMVGRGTRIYPGKDYLTVIDFVDNTYRQNLQTTASLVGIPGNLDFQGQDVLEVKSKVDDLLELAPNFNLDKLDINRIKYIIEEVDLLSGLKMPEELEAYTQFDWHKYDDGVYRISLSDNRFLTVKQDLTDQWLIEGSVYDPNTKKLITKEAPGRFPSVEKAIEKADTYIVQKCPDQVTLVNTLSKWRKQTPSEKQLEYLKLVFRVNDTVLMQLDRGQASRLITKLKTHKERGYF